MKGKLIDLTIALNGRQRVTIELDQDFRETYDELKDHVVDVEIKKHHDRRSLSANAYFHVLVNKIAARLKTSDDAVKTELVLGYGALDRMDNGGTVGAMIPSKVDISKYYKYAKCFDTRIVNGVEFKCYLMYKHTSDMDSAEMARLIDGAISEAKELGIETDTPEQLAKYKEDWSNK